MHRCGGKSIGTIGLRRTMVPIVFPAATIGNRRRLSPKDESATQRRPENHPARGLDIQRVAVGSQSGRLTYVGQWSPIVFPAATIGNRRRLSPKDEFATQRRPENHPARGLDIQRAAVGSQSGRLTYVGSRPSGAVAGLSNGSTGAVQAVALRVTGGTPMPLFTPTIGRQPPTQICEESGQAMTGFGVRT